MIVHAGSNGRFLGRVDLYIGPPATPAATPAAGPATPPPAGPPASVGTTAATRRLRIQGRLIPVDASIPEDRKVVELLRPYAAEVTRRMSVEVGHADGNLTIDRIYLDPNPLASLVAEAMRRSAGAELAVQNAGGVRAPWLAGAITLGDVMTALPFENQVVTVSLSGKAVRSLVEQALSRRGAPGFAHFAGLRATVRRGRLTELRVGGLPIQERRRYRVAVSDFLLNGGDGYRITAPPADCHHLALTLRDAMLAYLRQHPRVRADESPAWLDIDAGTPPPGCCAVRDQL
jgi:2',3'-cyclic-nucleotide 2'-phosphodiesterase (5'-nucleotidase family)